MRHRGKKHLEMEKSRIEFIARHYRRGAFDSRSAWLRLGIASPIAWWRRGKVAAAVAAGAILTASAAILCYEGLHTQPEAPAQQQTAAPAPSPLKAVKAIDFTDAMLPAVLREIRSTYGVEIHNVPENAASYRLTLHYEGNAADLVATINEILGTEMTVSEP